jgi:hypothetical protein
MVVHRRSTVEEQSVNRFLQGKQKYAVKEKWILPPLFLCFAESLKYKDIKRFSTPLD